MTPYIAQIILLGFNFNPKGWLLCQGQLLSIQQNAALFSLLGTTYGGNGTLTFGLPDLRGRTPIHPGQGPGLPNYVLGELAGTEATTVLASNLPLHNHLMNANTSAGNSGSPATALLAAGPTISGSVALVYGTSANTTMLSTALASAGGNQPVSILQPYLTLNYSIALNGIFPSRS
jgi:microcystin-dependent protein